MSDGPLLLASTRFYSFPPVSPRGVKKGVKMAGCQGVFSGLSTGSDAG